MAIRKRQGRASPYQVYWNNPYTKKRESASFATLKEARAHDSLIAHRLEHERESFKSEEDLLSTGGTVREIILLYLSSKEFSPTNLKQTLYHLKHISKELGSREIASLEKRDLVIFIESQVKKVFKDGKQVAGVKSTTAHRRLSILRSALSWAKENGFIELNPLHGIRLPKGQPERIAPPTQAELLKLMEYAPGHLQRAILLSVSLGVRVGPSELLSLKWRDVDLERKTIRVWSAKKNLNIPYRDIPLRNDIAETMKAWLIEDADVGVDTIVHYMGKPLQSIKTAWKKCKEAAGITRKLRPYDLRHAFATYALDAGADIQAVADMMGHRDATMILRHYQHGAESARRAAVESLPPMPAYLSCVSSGHMNWAHETDSKPHKTDVPKDKRTIN